VIRFDDSYYCDGPSEAELLAQELSAAMAAYAESEAVLEEVEDEAMRDTYCIAAWIGSGGDDSLDGCELDKPITRERLAAVRDSGDTSDLTGGELMAIIFGTERPELTVRACRELRNRYLASDAAREQMASITKRVALELWRDEGDPDA
jgi:hypothetical protein